MTEVKASAWLLLSKPGVVQEMQSDPTSKYWDMCYEVVPMLVRREMMHRNLPLSLEGDLVQQVMLAVLTGLPSFREECRFTTWLAQIAVRKVIDRQRYDIRNRTRSTSLEELEEVDGEAAWQEIAVPRTVEDDVLTYERVQEVMTKLRDFLAERKDAVRDEKILNWALIDDCDYSEIALELAVERWVVRYIVYAARRYLKEQLPSDR